MLSMMSASTVDAAVERTCVGDAHGPHRPVSAISRGRRGRWWRAAARTAAAGAALRNAREDSVTVMYHYYLGLALRTEAELASVKYPDTNELPAKPGALGRRAP